MAVWFDDECNDAWEAWAKAFPDAGWGFEGCGLTADEAIDLMRKSVATGHDYLSESFQEYPADALIGA